MLVIEFAGRFQRGYIDETPGGTGIPQAVVVSLMRSFAGPEILCYRTTYVPASRC